MLMTGRFVIAGSQRMATDAVNVVRRKLCKCITGMLHTTYSLQLLLLVREERASALYSSRMPAMTSSCMLHSAALACTSACSSLQHGQSKQ